MASEKPAAAAAPAEPAAGDAPKKKSSLKMIIAAVAVVVIEGGIVGLTMMLSKGPKQVMAQPVTTAPAAEVEHDVEVKLFDARLPNKRGGSLFLYDLQVVIKVAEKNKVKVTEARDDKDAEIRDQIRTIIASSEQASLEEPGLETLRRQISYEVEKILGKDLIKEVLIPKCTPIQTQF